MKIPTDYEDGYAKARVLDPGLAKSYIESVLVGDPLADKAMQQLQEFDQEKASRLINSCMEQDDRGMKDAPSGLIELFQALDNPPFRFCPDRALPGCRAFHKYSDMFFVGLVLNSLVTGLTEGLSKSFHITGRTAGNLRRVKQNTRHVVEITLPGGLDREGEGWKLSVRIRLIHAKLRILLMSSNDWDVVAEGVPIHMGHLALATTGFSAINLQAARMLGVPLAKEESEGFMHIWHYVAWLMGLPEDLLKYFQSESDAMHIRKIAYACEIPPGERATEVAHGYLNTVPQILGITDEAKQKKLMLALFRVARALMGHDLADTLKLPKQSTFGALGLVRLQRQLKILVSKFMPKHKSFAVENFAGLLQRCVYDDMGISYRMPDALKDSHSSPW